MVIKKCYIESFGCFKNQTFDFSDGINIIYGENEKGKSTIAAFIRFVLFGFSKKQERDRYFPLDISFASGSIEIDTGDKNITLSRSCKGTKETVLATDNKTGLSISELSVKNAGEILTGASKAAFERTLFVPQKQMEISSDEDINSRLRALVNTGSEDINLDKVKKKLDNIRALYYHVKENGGPLYELRLERDRQYYELEKSKALFGEYEICLNEYKNLQKEKKALEEELKGETVLFEKQKKYEKFKRFSHIKQRKTHLDSINEKLLDAKKNITFDGEILSIEYIFEMEKRRELKKSLANEKASLEKEVADLFERKTRQEKSKAIFEELSFDIDSRKRKETQSKEKIKKAKIFGGIVLSLGVLSLGLMLLSPYFSFVGAVFITLGVMLLLKGNKNTSDEILTKYGVSDMEELLEKKAALSGESKALEYLLNDIEDKKQRIKDIEEKLSCCLEIIKEDLRKFNKDEDADYQKVTEEIKTGVIEYTDIKNRKEVLEESYKAAVQGFSFSEEEIKEFENLSEEDSDFEKTVDEDSLNMKKQKLSALIEEILNKKSQVDGIYMGKELPSQILSRINSLDKEISQMEKNYKSVKLALSVLEKAEEEIKNTFAPILNQNASDLVAFLSDNKYKKIFIDENYNITADKEGKSYEGNYLSTGMADMVFFCVRSAISGLIYSEDMPMFFDDSFVYMDDERLKNMGKVLSDMGEKRQLFIFTCQKREEELIFADKVIRL